MRSSWRYMVIGIGGIAFLILFTFTKIPEQTAKIVSLMRKTFKQAVFKEAPTPRYDVITSASIRVDNEKLSFSQDKS